MSNRRIVSVAAVSTSGTAYTGRADGLFSTNDQAKLKQAGVWPTAIKAPSAPTAASATAGNLQATVSFTTPSSLNGETITSYTVTSLPGSVTATGASSPITVSGLTGGTSYTFTVVANTASGASLSSASSSSITIVAITYSDEVFSTYLYTGNGTTQTINNGIDLAGQGGLVWCKYRSHASYDHMLVDTARGVNNRLISSSTTSQLNASNSLTSFNSDGFSLGNYGDFNANNAPFVSWTFRKAAKFFDIVTYTGNGTTQNIAHNLGSVPGCIIVKKYNGTSGWCVYHRSIGNTQALFLNVTLGTGTWVGSEFWNNTTPTSTQFSVGGNDAVNNSGGVTYVAYLFAHDTAADGMIKCGSYTATGLVNLGFEPQYILSRCISTNANWKINDSMRGIIGSTTASLATNTASAEENSTMDITLAANGFNVNTLQDGAGTYIYMAIRRPNKPPTSGTQVFSVGTRTDSTTTNDIITVDFTPDLIVQGRRTGAPSDETFSFNDRLRGGSQILIANKTSAETTGSKRAKFDVPTGTYEANWCANTIYPADIVHFAFKRAPGFFDIVCYTGTDSDQSLSHNLGVNPQLIFTKARTAAPYPDWYVYSETTSAYRHLMLNSTAAVSGFDGGTWWSYAEPTTSIFHVNYATGRTGHNYVAYLFATLAGISKVGSYTGNGSSQTINCGFTTGARFILIKRTDADGDWYIWDTARGITASANDPHLSLNTTATEVTTDNSIDPANSGFIAIQNAATNINVTSATYIFLAIA